MFEESIFFLCQKLVCAAKTHFREMVLAQFGFTDGREVGILFIAMDTQLSQTEIANIVEIDKNTTRFFIDDLEQRGLLQRQKNPTNRKENLRQKTSQKNLFCDASARKRIATHP